MKRTFGLGVALGVTLTCWTSAWAQNLEKITIGISSDSLTAAGARIAKQMGLFEKHGLDPDIKTMESGSIATTGLLGGSLDFVMGGPSDAILASARGQKLMIVLAAYRGFSGTLVLGSNVAKRLSVNASAPIEDRLKALNGLIIAVPSATSPFATAVRAAEEFGVKPRLVYMAQPAMMAALESGAIDGFQAGPPNWTTPVLRGTAVAWIVGPKGEYPAEYVATSSGSLNTREALVREKPELIAKMRRTFEDMARAFRDEPEKVKAAVAVLYPQLSPDALKYNFDVSAQGYSDGGKITVQDLKHEIVVMKKGGIDVTENLDLAALIVP